MSSLGSWMNFRSPVGFQNIDSGLETPAYSLTDATSQLLRAQLHNVLDTFENMASSRDLQVASENNPPVTSSVVDWVRGQSKQDVLQYHPAAAMPQRDQNVTPPPRPIPSDEVRFSQARDSTCTAASQTAGRVYSIETLLKLRETQSAVPVMLRVKPEAIAQNIFQHMGAATTRRLPTRSRGLSEMSNISRGSNEYHHQTAFKSAESTSANLALHQPFAPPETSALQRNDGFFRFLKQHASPPHQRVTAGGRIVPAGPSSPPPMFDYASLNGLVRDRPPVTMAGQHGGNLNIKAPYVQAAQEQHIPSMKFGGCLANQGDRLNDQQVPPANAMQASVPYNHIALGNQPLMAPPMQTLTTVMHLGTYPDGTTLVSFNGNNYRTYWSGSNLVMEPLSATAVSTEVQSYTAGAYQKSSLNNTQNAFRNHLTQAASSSVPFARANNGAHFQACNIGSPSEHQTGRNEDDMKAQLSNLDKYLALHHYDIIPDERTAFVAQRRHLIEEIDKIRARKEQTKHTIPIIETAAEAVIAPSGKSSFRLQNTAAPPIGQLGAAQKPVPTKIGIKNYSLSPAAPPFVPKGMQSSRSISPGVHPGKESTKEHEQGKMFEPRAIQTTTLDIMDIANAAISRKGKALHADTSSSLIDPHEEDPSSSVLDPSDPAMRVIEYEDIEYAARYLYNWTQDTKTYCTTVEEFQEAIRRVREQARMFGCAGGSSNDPAYDAEQDLWWAICERDPIPLPTAIPDHVTNPRPWNWNDSAFNYRRKGGPWPPPACDHARNSPRLSGWDPSVTDSMKDIMDVSRSYFALKGQLPSVPFRDYAYDRHGNKVQIKPEVTDPTARFRASRSQAAMDHSAVLDDSLAKEADEATHASPTVNSTDLEELTANDFNGGHIGLIRTSRAKSYRKKNLTDGDAQRLVPTLSADQPTKPRDDAGACDHTTLPPPTPILPHARLAMITPRHCTRLRQPYVEDFPETPSPQCRRADSKVSPTPRKNALSTFSISRESTDLNFKNDEVAEPFQEGYQFGSEMANSCDKSQEINDPWSGPATNNAYDEPQDNDELWYKPALDPITLEFLARLKTWRPGDPDVEKTLHAELEACEKDEFGFPKFTNYTAGLQSQYTDRVGELTTSRSSKISAGAESCVPKEYLDIWNTRGLSAQTRSPWGPEDDSQSFESHYPWNVTKHDTEATTHEDAKVAKVSIPNTAHTPDSSVHGHSNGTAFGGLGHRKAREKSEVDSINITRPADKNSLHFLRAMLKSPPFTSSRPQKAAEQISAALKNSRSKVKDAKTIMTPYAGNKENTISNGPSDFKSAPLADLSRSTSPFKYLPNISVGKGPSSSASSIVQARGPLDPFEVPGKDHKAPVRYEPNNQLPRSPVRVNLPSQNAYPSAYGSGQSTPAQSSRNNDSAGRYSKSVNHYMPVNFGFDGGSDTPAPEKNATPTSNQHTNPDFDYNGVTTVDYQHRRPDPNNEWHRGQVADFFHDLAQKERKEMSDHNRADRKRAA
ncbi:hypothetical protein N7G274_002873 [Stereocaulon virgatum]|uniref:Uncharacterized protein n=1 Tax=Stereocaulon virgatum TaxID=373712 RepID=A0ABR4AL59_9LECA